MLELHAARVDNHFIALALGVNEKEIEKKLNTKFMVNISIFSTKQSICI